ncbi:hypothetical protein BKA93DRAFT_829244 [Sparassis latifolia]
MSLPKGLARKFFPKYISPYKIAEDYGNSSFRIELPWNLKRRGIYNVFHASLLHAHKPNDDRLFLRCLDSQIAELEDHDNEWAIDEIIGHTGAGTNTVFEAVWKSGDRSWVPYMLIAHLGAMRAYLEALGVEQITHLPSGTGTPPPDPQIFVVVLSFPMGRFPIKGAAEDVRDIDLLHLLYSDPALFFAEVMVQHAYLTRLTNHDILLHNGSDTPVHFVASQLHLYSVFDQHLHQGASKVTEMAMLGEYAQF